MRWQAGVLSSIWDYLHRFEARWVPACRRLASYTQDKHKVDEPFRHRPTRHPFLCMQAGGVEDSAQLKIKCGFQRTQYWGAHWKCAKRHAPPTCVIAGANCGAYSARLSCKSSSLVATVESLDSLNGQRRRSVCRARAVLSLRCNSVPFCWQQPTPSARTKQLVTPSLLGLLLKDTLPGPRPACTAHISPTPAQHV